MQLSVRVSVRGSPSGLLHRCTVKSGEAANRNTAASRSMLEFGSCENNLCCSMGGGFDGEFASQLFDPYKLVRLLLSDRLSRLSTSIEIQLRLT